MAKGCTKKDFEDYLPASAAILTATFDDYLSALARMNLKLYKHFEDRELSLGDLRVLSAVSLLTKGAAYSVSADVIAKTTHLALGETKLRIENLLPLRYLFEVVPIYGQHVPMYKIGSMGGVLRKSIRAIFEEESGKPKE